MKDIFKNKYERYAFLCLAELILLIAVGCILSGLVCRDGLVFQKKMLRNTMETIRQEAEKRYLGVEKKRDAYDEIYRSRAEYAAFYSRKDGLFVRNDEGMRKLRDMLECTNVFLLDPEGNILAKSGDTTIDFKRTRYNELRTVFQGNASSEPFQVTGKDHEAFRYYGALIDDFAEIVVEKKTDDLESLCKTMTDREAFLSSFLYGEGSYCFAVSDLDDSILYDSRGSKATDTASANGIDRSLLKDGKVTSRLIPGMLVGSVYLKDQQEYVVFCIPKKDSDPAMPLLVGAMILVMGLIFSMVLLSDGRKKGVLITLTGIFFVLILSYYMTELHGVSLENHKKQVVYDIKKKTARETDRYKQEINDFFEQRYMTQARAASNLIGNNTNVRGRRNMRALCKALGVDYILIYNKDMKLQGTNSDWMNLNLSKDENDPFYELSRLRFGYPEMIWGPKDDPITGEYHEYFGVSMKNQDTPEGFILMSVKPERWILAEEETNTKEVPEYRKVSKEENRKHSITLSWLMAGMTLLGGMILLILKGSSPEKAVVSPSAFLKGYLIMASAIVSLIVLLPEHFLVKTSVLSSILSGEWKRGLNIYAFTAVLIALAVFSFVIALIGWITRLLSQVTDPQTSQMILAAGTALKGLGGLLWLGTALYFLGVPVRVMVLILVILLLVIGFGGNSVIGDIFAGFYIYLSGLLHVGDRIGVDGHTGTVKLIGLTHTLLEDDDNNKTSVGNRKLTGNLFTIYR